MKITPRAACAKLIELGVTHTLLFDGWRAPSSRQHPGEPAPKRSLLMCQPRAFLTERAGEFYQYDRQREGFALAAKVEDAVAWLRSRNHATASSTFASDLEMTSLELPFVSGLAGALGFEFAWCLDRVDARMQTPRAPRVWVGDFACAAVYLHDEDRWVRVGDSEDVAWGLLGDVMLGADGAERSEGGREVARGTKSRARPPALLRFEEDPASAYRERVEEAIEAIVERGDLFEINYAERFEIDWEEDGYALYEALCEVASGDHFGYLRTPEFELASVSPERFLRVEADGRVITRPIKGSMRRSEDPTEDRSLAQALLASEKDRAENIMIVDLMRNDLTQVCRLGTVEATALCELESFAGIHHLVSTVEGVLEDGFDGLDALLASFPAGSITGAPKLRSIEYIAELEGSARGFYTGSLFYASSHGELDSSVLIRTAEIVDGKARYGAGGAVVADSDPERERLEALLKLAPLERALGLDEDPVVEVAGESSADVLAEELDA